MHRVAEKNRSVCANRSLFLQPLIATLHLRFHTEQFDRVNALEGLEDEAVAPRVQGSPVLDRLFEKGAEPESRQRQEKQESHGYDDDGAANEPDEGEKEENEWQVDEGQSRLPGIVVSQRIDRLETRKMHPGRISLEIVDLALQHVVQSAT